jgi:thiol-disulfide isomerase/thioredoxin
MLKALLLAGALVSTLAVAGARGQTPRAPATPRKGAAKTPADKLKATDKPKVTEIDEVKLKTLLGAEAGRARPLLVNFWATWCTPCREEFPDLVKIRAQYAAEKLDFVLVSLDDPADIGTAVPQFLSEVRAVNFPSYLLHATDDGSAINLVDPTWSGELPATFLYDRSGAIVFKHKGRIKPDELRAALDHALKDKPQEAGARK